MESMRDKKEDSPFLNIQDSLTPISPAGFRAPESVAMILSRYIEAMNDGILIGRKSDKIFASAGHENTRHYASYQIL